MTPTQAARRSDVLYADGARGMTRRVLCDMVVRREADLEDARAENARLRELVRDMWRGMPKSESCAWDSRAGCCTGECSGECSFWHRMHELGVEVDG